LSKYIKLELKNKKEKGQKEKTKKTR
jgi:hypothetical protein